ncbi:MAG: DUF1643 domain-containing protein [Acidimicrobiales bacterium]
MSRWPLPAGVHGSAMFSPDGNYRYWLERGWDRRLPRFTYVLLNPSRASGHEDDPTTRKLQSISVANGGGGYVLVNLFASVDTRQTGLHRDMAVGASPEANDGWLNAAVACSPRIVVGWGTGTADVPHVGARRRAILRRARDVWPVLRPHELWCVGHNRGGSPRHPGRGVRNDALLHRYVPTDGYPVTSTSRSASGATAFDHLPGEP